MKPLQLLERLPIRAKMAIAFLSVSIMSVLLLSASSHHYYSKAVKKDFFNISYEATNRLNYFLEYYFTEFKRSSSSLIQSSSVQGWLTSRQHTNEDIDIVQKELQHYVALNFPEIQDMFLVSTDRSAISMRQNFSGNQDFSSEPWFGMPLQSGRVVLPTHVSKQPGYMGDRVLSVILPIFGIDSQQLIGNLVINISLTEIRQAFSRSRLGETGEFFILSDDGTVVYHANSEWNGLAITETSLKSLKLSSQQEATIQKFQGKDYLLAETTSSLTNWKIVSMVPFSEMAGELRSATVSMLIVLGIISLFILLTVPLLAARFVRPILILKNLMRRVAGGDLTVRSTTTPGQDEFQQLNHSFNIMVGRLEGLFHTNVTLQLKEVKAQLRQKEAHIKALQNQINPHLLYNTLGIIQSMAYLEGMPIIEQMARDLADVYRYTARFSDLETTLDQEIVHLKKYLDIIHIRFPNGFQSHVYVNEKFMACPVIKLILQPILENAVKYAIEPMEGKGAIIVSAYDDKDVLVIEIADNGPGIEPDKLRELNEVLNSMSEHEVPLFQEGESLGITNVHARLVLKYGSAYGVQISSFPGRGTVVSLRVPLIRRDPPTGFGSEIVN
jgi:two-component system sensor histidine kinase YesM